MEAIAIIGSVAAIIAATFEIRRWARDRIKLEITWRLNVPGEEVETLKVHRGILGAIPKLSTYVRGPLGIAMPYDEPDFPCKDGYLIVTLTKRSKGPLQLRDIYLEMNGPDGTKIHDIPHSSPFVTLGLNDPHRFFAPHDEVDLSNAAIVIETDRETFRKTITGN